MAYPQQFSSVAYQLLAGVFKFYLILITTFTSHRRFFHNFVVLLMIFPFLTYLMIIFAGFTPCGIPRTPRFTSRSSPRCRSTSPPHGPHSSSTSTYWCAFSPSDYGTASRISTTKESLVSVFMFTKFFLSGTVKKLSIYQIFTQGFTEIRKNE